MLSSRGEEMGARDSTACALDEATRSSRETDPHRVFLPPRECCRDDRSEAASAGARRGGMVCSDGVPPGRRPRPAARLAAGILARVMTARVRL